MVHHLKSYSYHIFKNNLLASSIGNVECKRSDVDVEGGVSMSLRANGLSPGRLPVYCFFATGLPTPGRTVVLSEMIQNC